MNNYHVVLRQSLKAVFVGCSFPEERLESNILAWENNYNEVHNKETLWISGKNEDGDVTIIPSSILLNSIASFEKEGELEEK